LERTASPPKEYVDIIIGYHHILLFAVAFGTLVFGTGYFIGYNRAGGQADVATAERKGAPSGSITGVSPNVVPTSGPFSEPVE
jgi:hypothetical protein